MHAFSRKSRARAGSGTDPGDAGTGDPSTTATPAAGTTAEGEAEAQAESEGEGETKEEARRQEAEGEAQEEEMSKYPKAPNVQPEVGLVKRACCDCGSVHTIGFTVDGKGIVRIEAARDNRATAQLRRGKFPYLKDPRKGDLWKMVRI